MAEIDHIVLLAENLRAGAEFVAERLGVVPQLAWRNAQFGTHSLGLRLGPQCHLEVMAIDPSAPRLPFPRWYRLDDPDMQRTLARRPRLFGWALRVPNLDAALKSARYDPGVVCVMRQGDLVWRQTVKPDGELIHFGAGPCLVERGTAHHPAGWLADQGCSLVSLNMHTHQPMETRSMLASVGGDAVTQFYEGNSGECRFDATIWTPTGEGLLL